LDAPVRQKIPFACSEREQGVNIVAMNVGVAFWETAISVPAPQG